MNMRFEFPGLLREKTLRSKLASVFVWLSVVAAGQVLLAFAVPRAIFAREDRVISTLMPISEATQNVRADVLSLIAGAAQWGLSSRSQDLALYREAQANLPKDISALAALGEQESQLSSQVKGLIQVAQDEAATVESIVAGADDGSGRVGRHVAAGFSEERDKLERFLSAQASLRSTIDQLRVRRVAEAGRLAWLLVGLLVLSASLSILSAYWLARKTVRAVSEAAATLERNAGLIASGDFTSRVELTTEDELEAVGEAVNSMVQKLGSSLQQVQVAVNESTVAVMQIATTAQEQERMATQQSVAMSQISQTIQELNQASQNTAAQAESVSQKSNEGADIARRGRSDVEANVSMMLALRERFRQTSERIAHLSEQIAQIGLITRTVADFAAQTNLLALNAAVEAARAGEQGRGFAVVASEVRKLADQSKTAAERIDVLVREVQRASDESVMAMTEGSRVVDDNASQAAQTGAAIAEIIDTLQHTVDSMQGIALAARQQSHSVEQVTQSITAINAGMRDTVSATTQTQEATARLNDLSLGLKELVAAYRI